MLLLVFSCHKWNPAKFYMILPLSRLDVLHFSGNIWHVLFTIWSWNIFTNHIILIWLSSLYIGISKRVSVFFNSSSQFPVVTSIISSDSNVVWNIYLYFFNELYMCRFANLYRPSKVLCCPCHLMIIITDHLSFIIYLNLSQFISIYSLRFDNTVYPHLFVEGAVSQKARRRTNRIWKCLRWQSNWSEIVFNVEGCNANLRIGQMVYNSPILEYGQ